MRSVVPISCARRLIRSRSTSVHLVARAGADDDQAAAAGKRLDVCGHVRGADQLQHDVGPAERAHMRERLVGRKRGRAQRGDARTQLRGADVGDDARAQEGRDLHRGGAHPAAGAVHEQRLAGGEPSLQAHSVKRGQEGLRRGRSGGVVERVGHTGELALVGDHALGQTAAADEPEGAVADGERRHSVATGDDAAAHLEPRHVLRRAGGHRVLALALEHVGRVHPCERGRDHDLETARRRIGPLLDRHHLAAADPVEDDTPHAGG